MHSMSPAEPRGREDCSGSWWDPRACVLGWLTSGRLYGFASLTRVWSRQGTSPYRFFSWL